MSWLQDALERFSEAFKWWFVLQPWEQGLRVRLGKHIKKFEGGVHFRIPYFDAIYKTNCRLRLSDIPQQTVTNASNETLTIAGALSYRVENVEPLFNKLHMAENTIAQTVQAIVAGYVATHFGDDCSPAKLSNYVNNALDMRKYGLTDVEYLLTDYARVKTYRFIMGSMERWNDHSLETDEPEEI